jgi:hypothetical protein
MCNIVDCEIKAVNKTHIQNIYKKRFAYILVFSKLQQFQEANKSKG